MKQSEIGFMGEEGGGIGSQIDTNPNVYDGFSSSLHCKTFYNFFISGQKEGLFLIDFCYFVNLSTILQVHRKHIIHLKVHNWLCKMSTNLHQKKTLKYSFTPITKFFTCSFFTRSVTFCNLLQLYSDLSCPWQLDLVHHQLCPLPWMSHECHCGKNLP